MAIDSDVLRAILVLTRFREVPRTTVGAKALIRTYYQTLHEIPVRQVPDKQAFSVAKRLYEKASKVIDDLSLEERIAAKSVQNAYRSCYEANERACIMLSNFPEEHYLNKAYDLLSIMQ